MFFVTIGLGSPQPSTEPKTPKPRKDSKKSPEGSLGPPDPRPPKVLREDRKVQEIVNLNYCQGGPGSVRLRFGDGTVRAVPVFGSGGSSGEGVFVCFSTVSQRTVPVPASVPGKQFRRFRFRFRFLGNPEGRARHLDVSGRKLSPHTVSRQFLTRNYPRPNRLLKCLPNCLFPTREGILSSFKITPAVRVIARQLRDKNCHGAIFAPGHQES